MTDPWERVAELACENLTRPFPVHWTHLIDSDADLVPQRELHPCFSGSYDWHSAVHQTWTLVRLLRLGLAGAAERRARATLDELLTPENCLRESVFFDGPRGATWERPYGWAWLVTLAAEAAGTAWGDALAPLDAAVRRRAVAWLDSARRPTRAGTHANSAFAAGLLFDAGAEEQVREAALRWFEHDEGYGGFEPDAPDFLSPVLTSADLMRRVLPAEEFGAWFSRVLPDLAAPRWRHLREPVEPADPHDPQGAHACGLVLSRAWCWRAVAGALPAGHPAAAVADRAAAAHTADPWRHVFGWGYVNEHWLGSFATYLVVGALR